MFSPSSTSMRYGLAVGAVAVALTCTQLFASLYHQGIVFLMLGSVMLAAWFGGRGPGFLATLLAGIGSLYFIVPPVSSFFVTGPADVIRLALFLGVCVLIVMLTDRQQRAHATLVKSKETLEREVLKRQHAEETLRSHGLLLEQVVSVRTAQLQETNHKLEEEIGRRMKVEDVLRQTNEQLETQVRERTCLLTKANNALQEKIEDLEKFYDLVVDRELKLIELEKEVETLKMLLLLRDERTEQPSSARFHSPTPILLP